ncbi:MAG TPA: prolyl oligopeptidase family serine peptidase [Longimicrobiaceae bacterium]
MNRFMAARSAAILLAAAACAPATPPPPARPPAPAARTAEPTAARPLPSPNAEDPLLWLEEVEGARAMEWVEAHNARTLEELEASPVYRPIFERTRTILDSSDRIALPSILGDRLYNFWQDAANPRGVWRRTTWESYLSGTPAWEVVLDVDALAREEGVPWSYSGANCLSPDYRRCLVRLSRGGADAVEVREFDLRTLRFLPDGFRLPEAKQSVDWVDENALLVSTDFGDGSMTASGYPRIAKLWRRGTPLGEARTIFTAESGDVGVWVGSWETAGRTLNLVVHRPSFFETSTHVLRDGDLVRLDLPLDADPVVVGDQLVVYLRSPWEVGGRSFPAGSLVHAPYDAFIAGGRELALVLETSDRQTISDISTTRDQLLVNLLDNVTGQLRRYRFADGRWTFEPVPAPAMGSIGVVATSPSTNRYFFTYSGFTQPTTLYLGEEGGEVREVRRMPAMFDAAGLIVEQHAATSRDGTRIPYFVVRKEGTRMDGTNPTLLYAYGGFEVAMTPAYSPATGAAWLERGGVYVLANIRGGGEFGPAWHRAAKLENRQRAYDDFLAVAEALVASRLTTPRHLGIMGGSNGGLLVGAALTQRPDLFNAVVIQVPLLDMRRYHLLLAGASWMAEYGDPDDPAQWEFIGRYSPYHNVRPGMDYPRVLFTTTTRDDRVHPGHARKMAARMEEMGYPVLYFENTEGGHGAGVTSEQRARMQAVTFAYLWEQLGPETARNTR